MAQWMGQFTGRTHESKVKEIEESLTKAVNAPKSATEESYDQKAKAVVHLSIFYTLPIWYTP